jgi:two-component system, NarL family, sensor histidine kinase UhpB
MIEIPGIAVWKRRSLDWRAIAKALIAILAVQALYWLVLDPWVFSPKPAKGTIEITRPELAVLPSPDPNTLARAEFEPIELPLSRCCEDGYFAFRAGFELADVPSRGLGLGPRFDADNFMVLVNGTVVHSPGEMRAPRQTFHGMNKRPLLVPAAALQPGANRLEIIMTSTGVPWLDIRGVTLGEYKALIRDGARRNFMIYDYRNFGGIAAGLIALLAVIVALRADQRAMALWLAMLAGAWGLRSLYHNWYEWPFGAPARIYYVYFLLNLLPLAWFNFVDSWTGHGYPGLRRALTGLFALTMAVWAALLIPDPLGWFAPSQEWLLWWGQIFGAATILRVFWHLLTRDEDRYWELALLLLCVVAVIRHWFDLNSMHIANTAPILLVALALAFLARNVRLFQSMGEFNRQLAGQLALREAELAGEYARQEELARRETLVNERQRLMRDMHDGIGGQLMSLLFAARQKALKPEDLTQGLQAVIDELRLIIDSLDTVGESLGAALASFRSRIEPRLNAAGIAIDWSNLLPEGLPELPPRTILQVFRIVQEAITNAIKHAGTKALGVAIGLAEGETQALRIAISDSGAGFDTDAASGGRGLENMNARAAAIGGALSFASGQGGTTVTLTVPFAE